MNEIYNNTRSQGIHTNPGNDWEKLNHQKLFDIKIQDLFGIKNNVGEMGKKSKGTSDNPEA